MFVKCTTSRASNPTPCRNRLDRVSSFRQIGSQTPSVFRGWLISRARLRARMLAQARRNYSRSEKAGERETPAARRPRVYLARKEGRETQTRAGNSGAKTDSVFSRAHGADTNFSHFSGRRRDPLILPGIFDVAMPERALPFSLSLSLLV